MARRARHVAACGALAIVLSGLLGSEAGAVTIGPTEVEPTTGAAIQCTGGPGATCSFVQMIPAVAAPFDGVVTRWRFRVLAGTGTARLRIVRGAGPAFTWVRSSANQSPDPGVHQYEEHLPISAGDRIGITIQDIQLLIQQPTGDLLGVWNPPAADGTNPLPTGQPPNIQLVLSADVERDVDGDTLGDETQDSDDDADGVADVSDNCPAVAGASQTDTDGDGQGDLCDADDDGDGLSDATEAAIGANPLNGDSDGDGAPDGRDPCILAAGPGGCPAPVRVEVPVESPKPPAAKFTLNAPARLSRRSFTGGVKVTVTPDQPVALRALLVTPGRDGATILREQALAFTGGVRTLKLKPPRRAAATAKRAEVRIYAINGAGLTTTAVKKIRISG